MYHGYTEPDDKIEERKRRILGTITPTEAPPAASGHKKKRQAMTPKELKRQIVLVAVFYPIAFFVGQLLGRYIETLVR